MKSRYYILSLLVALSLTGCKVKRPKDVIPESQMEEILYDYHIAKAMGDNLPYTDNYKKALYTEYVFKKHGTTEEHFDSSMVWYTRNTEVLSKIYDNVTDRLKTQQNSIEDLVAIRDNKPKTSQPGDSIDVWLWDRLYYLTGKSMESRVNFNLATDTNFHKRDTLVWQMDYRFLGFEPDSADAPFMAMQILYSTDSIASDIQKIYVSGTHRITLQADTFGDIKEIRGFVYYTGVKDSLNQLLLDQVSLMRYHSKDTLATRDEDYITELAEMGEASEKKEEKSEVTPEPQKPIVEPIKREIERPRPAIKREVQELEREEIKLAD